MCQTDEKYVHECLAGSPEAYRLLVQRYQNPLLRYLRGELGCEEAALEASQETFVRAYFALRKLRKPESFSPGCWESLVAFRKRRTAPIGEAGASTHCLQSRPNRPSKTVRRTIEFRGRWLLPDVYRQVVLLRYYAGRSCTEISRDLNMPLGPYQETLPGVRDSARIALGARPMRKRRAQS